MVSIRSKRGTHFAGMDERSDACVRRAGIDNVFAAVRAMGPDLLRLQQGVMTGLVQSQAREAERLAAADKDDPRAAAARLRAERLGALAAEVERAGQAVGRFVKGVTRGGMFHGYVIDEAGQPAAAYLVRVSGAAAAEGKVLKAKTDDTGYFRIEFDKPKHGARSLEGVMAAAASRDK